MELGKTFWNKVEITDTCWLWKAYVNKDGYGNYAVKRRIMLAHRVSYIAHKSPITDGLVLDHLCSVRNCVNPDHLEAVTNAVNIRRGKKPLPLNKTHCKNGHEYTQDNTYLRSGKSKECRICRYNQDRKRKLKTR